MNLHTEPHQNPPSGSAGVPPAERKTRGRDAHAPIALILPALLLLAGCAGQGSRDADGGPDYRRLDPTGIPDAVPRVEPRSKYGNMASYKVRGKVYRTKQDGRGHVEHGLASWYGKQFNGRRTSSGERYDMYGMTAAHKTLPLPSYARVTNLENGRSAVVRINDRGPFHGTRVIDLSYAAATKIGVFPKGTATVEIRGIDPANPGAVPAPAGGAGFGTDAGFVAAAAPAPFWTNQPGRASGDAIARSLAIANRGSAPPPRPAARPADARERAATAAFAAVDAEPGPAPFADAAPTPAPAAKVVAARPRATGADSNAADGAADTAGPGRGLFLQVGAFGDPRNAERLRERLRPQLTEPVRVQRSAAGASDLYKVRVGPLGSESDARRLSAKLTALGIGEAPRLTWN
ncbi:septal ring lytic transglycosylase RlpA family protein [uncultured Thiodictyon sp.]|jgi:rare lipoprotein A|uniref:septal ring lytic transglycosylase RlpA family protein n=1 Tax=uncultured Thiodictyon sp. TaxID=1846217 RepID=UPI0025E57CFB|nr:septal ring lytic transglycosylase RlpA family protein [uncultured Thiodictyon sp.]